MNVKNQKTIYIIIAIFFVLSLLITFFNYKFRYLNPDADNLVLDLLTDLLSPIIVFGITFYSYYRLRFEKVKILKIGEIISIIIGVSFLVLTFVSIFTKNENILNAVDWLLLLLVISIFIEGIIRAIYLSIKKLNH